MNIITLVTDFGFGKYVAAMKGIILEINPHATIVDIHHEVKPQNVREGAYVMFSALRYFPPAIHIGVIDPGVGTERRSIIAECQRGLLVGPDNGLLIPAAKALNLERVYEITNRSYCRPVISPTFHGRDVFAPVAAHLSLGVEPGKIGTEIEDWVDLDFGRHSESSWGVKGEVIYTDRFGNVITNIPREVTERLFPYGSPLDLSMGGRVIGLSFLRTYGLAPKGSLLATISSSDFLEIAVNGGNAAQQLGAREGFEVVLSRRR